MQVKLTRGTLIGDTWHECGSVVTLDNRMAETFVKAGAALPLPLLPVAAQATANLRQAERATAPRQR